MSQQALQQVVYLLKPPALKRRVEQRMAAMGGWALSIYIDKGATGRQKTQNNRTDIKRKGMLESGEIRGSVRRSRNGDRYRVRRRGSQNAQVLPRQKNVRSPGCREYNSKRTNHVDPSSMSQIFVQIPV